MKKLYNYSAEVLRVKDGDTLKALVCMGMGVFHMADVRLVDIQAPELGKDGGPEARDFLESRISGVERVFLSSIKRDGFGRWLSYIWVPHMPEVCSWDLQETLNVEMIGAGHAVPYVRKR